MAMPSIYPEQQTVNIGDNFTLTYMGQPSTTYHLLMIYWGDGVIMPKIELSPSVKMSPTATRYYEIVTNQSGMVTMKFSTKATDPVHEGLPYTVEDPSGKFQSVSAIVKFIVAAKPTPTPKYEAPVEMMPVRTVAPEPTTKVVKATHTIEDRPVSKQTMVSPSITKETPTVSPTINYTATMEMMQKRIDEQDKKIASQDGWIEKILRWLHIA
jgi:hypothetical protein